MLVSDQIEILKVSRLTRTFHVEIFSVQRYGMEDWNMKSVEILKKSFDITTAILILADNKEIFQLSWGDQSGKKIVKLKCNL